MDPDALDHRGVCKPRGRETHRGQLIEGCVLFGTPSVLLGSLQPSAGEVDMNGSPSSFLQDSERAQCVIWARSRHSIL